MNKLEFVLQENVLTDNLLVIPEKGFIFKGGYIAIVKEYTFLNAWNDKEKITKFRNKKRLFDYLSKKYPDLDLDLTDTILGE